MADLSGAAMSVAVEHPSISIGVLLEYGGRYRVLNEILGENVSNATKALLEQIGANDTVTVWKYAENAGDAREQGTRIDLHRHRHFQQGKLRGRACRNPQGRRPDLRHQPGSAHPIGLAAICPGA
jgi:hypothetical protein